MTATQTLSLQWMEKVCTTFSDWAKKPKRIGEWVAATDGHVLVAVKSAIEIEEPTNKAKDSVGRLLNIEPAFGPIAGDVLRNFARRPDTCKICRGKFLVECANCHGEGEADRQCDCCDEWHRCKCDCTNGKQECMCTRRPVYGLLFGSTVDCRLLFDAVENIAFDEFRWAKDGAPDSQDTAIILGTEDWRIVVMPMRPGCQGDEKDVRVLDGVAA